MAGSTTRRKLLAAMFGMLAICGRVGYYVITPLWLDHFNGNTTEDYNTTTVNSTMEDSTHRINPCFVMVSQMLFATLVFGAGWLCIAVFAPRNLNEVDKSLPQRQLVVIGVASGISSVLFNYSLSGTRTPLYLEAILSDCNIPIQFTVRFLLLRRRPTWIKLTCAIVVALAELVCLIPSIFPDLEPASAHKSEGGSTGAWKFLWPMILVLSLVPFAVGNTLMERSVQAKHNKKAPTEYVNHAEPGQIQTANGHVPDSEGQGQGHDEDQCQGRPESQQIHLVVFLFWWCLFVLLTVSALFWADLIPGFGTSSSFENFALTVKFNTLCLMGKAGCGPSAYMLGFLNFSAMVIGCIAFAGLMRFSEGANYVIILLTMRTPLVFLFWALFQETPFRFSPHAYLSTWLSIGAIVIMVVAVIIYDLSPPEKVASRRNPDPTTSEDRRNLLATPAAPPGEWEDGQSPMN